MYRVGMSGPPALSSSILIPLAWVACLHLAAWTTGSFVMRALFGRTDRTTNPVCDAFLSLCLGVGVLAVGAFTLGVTHLLYSGILIGITLALCVIGTPSAFRALRNISFRPTADDIPLAIAVAFTASFLPYAVSPILGHDESVYHLLIPRLYLEHHALIPLPYNLFANMPHLVELWYAWAMAIGDYTAPKVLSFASHAWLLVGLLSFTLPRLGRLGSGVIALLFVSGQNIQFHLGLANVEPTVALFLLGAILAFLRWQETQHTRYLHIVGIACGLACSAKYSAWFFAAAILVVTLVVVLRTSGHRAGRWRQCAIIVGICALVVLPWLIKNAAMTGNPFYPNLYRILDGANWSQIQETHLLRSDLHAGGSEGYLESLPTLPFKLMRGGFFYSPSFSASLMVLFLIALVLPPSYRSSVRFLVLIVVVGFLGWAFSIRQGRFLVGWVPAMTLVASLALIPLRRWPRSFWACAVIVCTVGLYQAPFARPPLGLLFESRENYRVKNSNYEVCQFLNRTVAQDGKVLILWDNVFFFLERPFFADSAYEAPSGLARLRRAGAVEPYVRELRDAGITHVVLNRRIMRVYFANRLAFNLIDDIDYPQARLDEDRWLMFEFIETQLKEIGRWDQTEVFELEPPS